jgi:putative NADH-flavin reductase
MLYEGAIGTIFCENAFQRGHHLTLFVRTLTRLSKDLMSHERVKVVRGALDNNASIEEAMGNEPEVFVGVGTVRAVFHQIQHHLPPDV